MMSLDRSLVLRISRASGETPEKVVEVLREFDESNVRGKVIREFRESLAQDGRTPDAASEKPQ